MENDPYLKVGKIEFYPTHPVYKTTYVITGNPHKCPICEGNGLVPKGFYLKTGDSWISNGTSEKCRSCDGKGIIWG